MGKQIPEHIEPNEKKKNGCLSCFDVLLKKNLEKMHKSITMNYGMYSPKFKILSTYYQ